MLRTLIVLPDGTEIFSGVGEQNAVESFSLTECVNDGQELTVGSTCSNMVELSIIVSGDGVQVSAGDDITVYRVDDEGTRHKVGVFTTEKPEMPNARRMKITAYDHVSWLDKDLTTWLASLNMFPCPLYQLADMVCAACKVVLVNEEIPNGDYLVQKFSADGITGRQIIKWIGQIAGRFCRATADGQIEFAWYEPLAATEIAAGADVVDVEAEQKVLHYFQNSLTYAKYQVEPVGKVQLRQNEEDIGTVYPDTEEELNTYIITGNYLLTASSADELVPVAQTLYEVLKDVTYTPCTVSVPASMDIHAGHIIGITDRKGRKISTYVMTKKQTGQKDTLEGTGSLNRGTSTVAHNQRYEAYVGKVLNLRKDVDGLKVENKDTTGRLAALEINMEGIRTDVSRMDALQEQMTSVKQTAENLAVRVQKIDAGKGDGATFVKTETGFILDDNGLSIEKSNEPMKSLYNHKGMYVSRNDESILRADADGVNAIDITVRNYLTVGKHARFEDYTDESGAQRMACFWV